MSKNNIQIKTSKKKGVKSATVNLTDEINIYNIEEIKDKIIKAVKDNDEIVFNAQDVKNIDLSFVQLLHSLMVYAEKNKKKISLNIQLNTDNKVLFENTDLLRIIK